MSTPPEDSGSDKSGKKTLRVKLSPEGLATAREQAAEAGLDVETYLAQKLEKKMGDDDGFDLGKMGEDAPRWPLH